MENINLVLLQYWEYSIKDENLILPDGCSIHRTEEDRINFIKNVYKNRTIDNIPNEYERYIGEPIVVQLDEKMMYNFFVKKNSIRLTEAQYNNLIRENLK